MSSVRKAIQDLWVERLTGIGMVGLVRVDGDAEDDGMQEVLASGKSVVDLFMGADEAAGGEQNTSQEAFQYAVGLLGHLPTTLPEEFEGDPAGFADELAVQLYGVYTDDGEGKGSFGGLVIETRCESFFAGPYQTEENTRAIVQLASQHYRFRRGTPETAV